MTDEKAEELFQRFVKGCWAVPKFAGMAIGGMGVAYALESMSHKPTILDAFFSSDPLYIAGFIVLWIICRNSYRKDFSPNDGKADHSKADHSKNEEVRAETPQYRMRPVRDLTT